MSFPEFVAMIAALMAVTALAIDAMLPALPQIGAALGVGDANRVQWVVSIYVLGMGLGQIIYGAVSDRYGRKPVLLGALIAYAVFSLVCAAADSFGFLLIARCGQGLAAAAMRVLSVSVVRDRFESRRMARVMSLSVMVFLAVPILAPSLGQLIMLVAPWRVIFVALAGFALLVAAWLALRLPETLHPEYRIPIQPARLAEAFRRVIRDRFSLGYTIAAGLTYGALIGYVSSVQQIFATALGAPRLFTLFFALTAGALAAASFVNSRIVERVGSRRVSHAAMLGMIAVSGVHVAVAFSGHETLWSFLVLQSGFMACFGLVQSNFGAMAMEGLGDVAGMASSVQGFITNVAGSLLGLVISQGFDGTTRPITLGFFVLSLLGLAVVLPTERWRLFVARHPEPHS